MMTDMDMIDQIVAALAPHENEFDIAGIANAIQADYGIVDIDTIPTHIFWAIVEKSDLP